jgi:hypothetical protein
MTLLVVALAIVPLFWLLILMQHGLVDAYRNFTAYLYATAMSSCESKSKAASACAQIRALYTDLALHPEKDFGWGTGRANAQRLGYNAIWLQRLPASIWEPAAAVGDPFSLGPIRAGETVVDLGCGAGADACVAALLVGPRGRVVAWT